MRTALRKIGNSTGVVVPKAVLTEIAAKAGDAFEVGVEEGRIVLAPVRKKVRNGWAEAAEAIAAADDAADFRSFANDDDDQIEW